MNNVQTAEGKNFVPEKYPLVKIFPDKITDQRTFLPESAAAYSAFSLFLSFPDPIREK